MTCNHKIDGSLSSGHKALSRRDLIGAAAAVCASSLFVPRNVFASFADNDMTIQWANNILSIKSVRLPSGVLRVLYQEEWCRSGPSNKRDWSQTVVPHVTRLVYADRKGKALMLESVVGETAQVHHLIRVVPEGIDMQMTLTNPTDDAIDIEWGVTCVQVGAFTGSKQDEVDLQKCFIFTEYGLTTLDHTRRTEDALYHGGQVYVPAGINPADVNERPLSLDVPVNGLIGCFSIDGRYLLATTWDPTERLFEGVLTCIHNDLRVGGLAPRQTKRAHGKIYLLKNDVTALLDHYHADFRSH